MSKVAGIGLFSCLGALVMLLFQAISSLMKVDIVYKNLSLVDWFGPEAFSWIDGLSWFGLEKILNHIVTTPLFVLLLCIGIFFLILSGFLKK
jgi:hypothetical protein